MFRLSCSAGGLNKYRVLHFYRNQTFVKIKTTENGEIPGSPEWVLKFLITLQHSMVFLKRFLRLLRFGFHLKKEDSLAYP